MILKTSSRKIDIIHRYVHCISYPGIEELETESSFHRDQVHFESSLCPKIIKKSPNQCDGVVYDNCDRFLETRSDKDTLRNTVGIIYQNIDLNTADIVEISDPPTPNYEDA